jgi:DNA-binding Lrp family transcriptional regulator
MIEIDATDRRILAVLQRDGRMTNADLASAVGLSASACHRRVQRLEEVGVIRGYVARDTDDFARIHRQRLAKLPGVAQMHSSFSLRTVAFTTALPV